MRENARLRNEIPGYSCDVVRAEEEELHGTFEVEKKKKRVKPVEKQSMVTRGTQTDCSDEDAGGSGFTFAHTPAMIPVTTSVVTMCDT